MILDATGKPMLNSPVSPFLRGRRVIECNRAFGICASDANAAHAAFNSLGTLMFSTSGAKWVKGVAIDDANDCYYLACSSSTKGVQKFSVWGKLLDTFGSLNGRGVAVDGSGNVYLAHVRTANVSVTKYNSAGTFQWSYDTGADANDIFVSTGGGFIAVAGQHNNSKSVWLLNSAGGLAWTYNIGAHTLAVCMDIAGNVYATINNAYYKFSAGGARIWIMQVPELSWYGLYWQANYNYSTNDRCREVNFNWWARRDHNSGDGSVSRPNTGSNYAYYWETRATIDFSPPYRACCVDTLRAYVGYSRGVACGDLASDGATEYDPLITLSCAVGT